MLSTTLQAYGAILKADPSVSPPERNRLMSLARQGPEAKETPAIIPTVPRFIRRAEVAERMSVSLRTIDKYAVTGLLRKRVLPGRKRASGFLAADVEALMVTT
ncbi:MAG: hypothetical protein L6437_04395, partial [Kiritimatiellae bacterium]|nr:hypothetical protein [Kiritimatiellia bacterium]